MSYEIILMGGKIIKEKIVKFFKSFNIKYGFILDRDVYMKIENKIVRIYYFGYD